MISIKFLSADGRLEGFSLTGHGTSDEGDDFGRIVCSAVSSAVYMAANTLTEIVGAEADVFDDGDLLSFRLTSKIPEGQMVLRGFELHVTELSREYPENIEIISEVF